MQHFSQIRGRGEAVQSSKLSQKFIQFREHRLLLPLCTKSTNLATHIFKKSHQTKHSFKDKILQSGITIVLIRRILSQYIQNMFTFTLHLCQSVSVIILLPQGLVPLAYSLHNGDNNVIFKKRFKSWHFQEGEGALSLTPAKKNSAELKQCTEYKTQPKK